MANSVITQKNNFPTTRWYDAYIARLEKGAQKVNEGLKDAYNPDISDNIISDLAKEIGDLKVSLEVCSPMIMNARKHIQDDELHNRASKVFDSIQKYTVPEAWKEALTRMQSQVINNRTRRSF